MLCRLIGFILLCAMASAQALVPGGMVSSHHYATGSATEMEVTIKIEVAPPNSSAYFWAQQFFTATDIDHGGYFGLQTSGILQGQNVGKMLIFSIWNADQAEAAPGSVAQTFGGEGIGYSIRRAFDWREGVAYRFRLEKDGSLWWKLSVTGDSGTISLGRIRITRDVPLRPGFASFTEYFGHVASCEAMPYTKASFSDFRYGSAIVAANDSAAYGNCVAQGRGSLRSGVAVHESGLANIPAVDEPAFTSLSLPLPANPAFPNCPGGYFVATIDDGPGNGLSPGIFGFDLLLNAPGTQRLEGGLNFGGLLDGSQVAFAGFNFQNPASEPQRLELTLTGSPASSQAGSLPVRIKIIRQPAAGVNELVLETTATLTMAAAVVRTIDLTPSFYVVTVAPDGSASVPNGAADGQVFVSLSSQFVGRPGGGFFAGTVVGGYHANHPFGGVSGFASFCLGSQHSASARVYAAPSYGATGAHDLRLRLIDHANRELIRLP